MQQLRNNRRALLITRNLPPLVGGMERMMGQFAAGLVQYTELTVIGPKGCKQFLPEEVTVRETSSQLGLFLAFATWYAVQACRKTHFDIVIGGSGLIGPTLRLVSRLFKYKTLVYLHGLDLVVSNPVYQFLFVPCLRRVDRVAVNSLHTLNLARGKGIAEQRIAVVNPGTHFPDPIDTASRIEFRRHHAIAFERYLVFTGRMTKRKGLSCFLQHIFPLILESDPDVGLVIVGENPNDSLNKMGEEAEVQQQIIRHDLQSNVAFLGKLTDRDLEICFAESAVQIFPLIEVPGDVEGFGMVAIEAAACGTPTVAFELGVVADAVSAENGHLVPPGDFRVFADQVLKVLRTGTPGAAQCLSQARLFTWQAYNERMRQLID